MRTVAYQTDGVFGTYVRLLTHEGDVLYESPNFQGHTALPILLPKQPIETVAGQIWEEGPIRSHYHPLFSVENDHIGWLEVSGFEWSLHQELDRLIRTFSIGIVISVLLALGGGYLLARRSLRPVANITRVANQIQVTSLNQRIPIKTGVEDELSRLASTINSLLFRIEASFQRERRFSANAAHELVTPLSAIRGELELAMRTADCNDDLRRKLQAALADADRMKTIIRSLLQLSSAERLNRAAFEPIDVNRLIEEHIRRFGDRASAERKLIDQISGPACFIAGDLSSVEKVVDNLLDNALKYTDEGGTVRVHVVGDASEVRITVEDDGIGFEPSSAEHIFDRFYRANTREVKSRSGSGLGLAIVAATVKAHGGSVSAKSAGEGMGSSFTMTLPRAFPS